jgi:hypothetical protein
MGADSFNLWPHLGLRVGDKAVSCKTFLAIVNWQSFPSNCQERIMAESLKPRSGVITDGPDRAPSRAMLKAAGFSDEDLRRPIVGVANTWI